jgi:hypothetical protein
MKRWIIALGTCATLSTLPLHAFAHGNDGGAAVLGGIVGGVVGGLIGSGAAPFPVYAAPAPVVVERYAPEPVVIERYAPAPVIVEPVYPAPAYYVGRYPGYRGHEGHEHRWHHDRWDDD